MPTYVYPTAKMADLIIASPETITVLERLDIPLGFGDQYIKEIAAGRRIDLDAFISILKVFESTIIEDVILEKKAIPDLLSFLKVSHQYFKEKQIPHIKRLISSFAEGIPVAHGNIIISFFDGYMKEVNEHFLYEDETVFPYIDHILSNGNMKGFDIQEFEKNHTDIEQKLLDLKNILIKYIPENVISPYRIMILKELTVLERDLDHHSFIENHILVPSIKEMEWSNR
jgi:regulator of cell morphogenesis and NO signaling